jgi:hypothetical protein
MKCEELGDQFECDANRTPICVVNDYTNYNKRGYEIYSINEDGSLKKIRDYDEVTDEYISYCEYNENESSDIPVKIVRLKEGDRDDITKNDIKEWCKRFGFTDPLKSITTDFKWGGEHGEQIGNLWCVIGETFDDWYPRGC